MWYAPTDGQVFAAAVTGELDILEEAAKNTLNIKREGQPLCELAALAGQKEILIFLLEHGAKCDIWACHYAAALGHIEILTHLRSLGIEWDKNTVMFAAYRGKADVVRYLIENKCPVEADALAIAEKQGHEEVCAFLRSVDLQKRASPAPGPAPDSSACKGNSVTVASPPLADIHPASEGQPDGSPDRKKHAAD